MSPEAREHARGALLALSEKELVSVEGQKHVMLSYQVSKLRCLIALLLTRGCSALAVEQPGHERSPIMEG